MTNPITIQSHDLIDISLSDLKVLIEKTSEKIEEQQGVFSVLSDLFLGMLSKGLDSTTVDVSDIDAAYANNIKELLLNNDFKGEKS